MKSPNSMDGASECVRESLSKCVCESISQSVQPEAFNSVGREH